MRLVIYTWQEVIAELLFKKPATPRELLSLEAYRELLWLYDLGQEIVYCTGSPAGLQLQGDRGVSHDRFILPWAQGEEAGPEQLSLDRLTGIDVAPELNAFGLDIDLTAMRGGAAAHAPEIAPQPPTPQATEAPVSDTSAFDSVMDSLGRRS